VAPPTWPALVFALTLVSAFFGACIGGAALAHVATAIATADIGSLFEARDAVEAGRTWAIIGIVLGMLAGAVFGYTAGLTIDRYLGQAESKQPPPRTDGSGADEQLSAADRTEEPY